MIELSRGYNVLLTSASGTKAVGGPFATEALASAYAAGKVEKGWNCLVTGPAYVAPHDERVEPTAYQRWANKLKAFAGL